MSAICWLIGTIFFCSAWGMPSAEARLASGSRSSASTRPPFRAAISAMAADMVDFPTPPLPETAIFMEENTPSGGLSRHLPQEGGK